MNDFERSNLRVEYFTLRCAVEELRTHKKASNLVALHNAKVNRLNEVVELLEGPYEWDDLESVVNDVNECSQLGVDGRSVFDHITSAKLEYKSYTQRGDNVYVHQLKVNDCWSPMFLITTCIIFKGHTACVNSHGDLEFGVIISFPVDKVLVKEQNP